MKETISSPRILPLSAQLLNLMLLNCNCICCHQIQIWLQFVSRCCSFANPQVYQLMYAGVMLWWTWHLAQNQWELLSVMALTNSHFDITSFLWCSYNFFFCFSWCHLLNILHKLISKQEMMNSRHGWNVCFFLLVSLKGWFYRLLPFPEHFPLVSVICLGQGGGLKLFSDKFI